MDRVDWFVALNSRYTEGARIGYRRGFEDGVRALADELGYLKSVEASGGLPEVDSHSEEDAMRWRSQGLPRERWPIYRSNGS